jgi:hypothetical protein
MLLPAGELISFDKPMRSIRMAPMAEARVGCGSRGKVQPPQQPGLSWFFWGDVESVPDQSNAVVCSIAETTSTYI